MQRAGIVVGRWCGLLLMALAAASIPHRSAPARTAPRPLPPTDRPAVGNYQELGKLPRPEACENVWPYARIVYISPNGETVAGNMNVDIGTPNHGHHLDHAFVWTRRDGLRDLGELLDRTHTSQVDAVSPDGTVVAGHTADSKGQWSFVWERGVGITENIPRAQTTFAHSVFQQLKYITSDSQYVVGRDASVTFRWNRDKGTEPLESIKGADTIKAGTGDGRALVGAASCEAFLWTEQEGMRSLGRLRKTPGSIAYGISEDGQVVVGLSGSHLFRWTRRTGMEDLGLLPDKADIPALPNPNARQITIENGAYDLSRDASTILGHTGSDFFLWTSRTGIVPLKELMPAFPVSGGVQRYLEIASLSPDGRTVWGISRDGRGNLYRWRLDL